LYWAAAAANSTTHQVAEKSINKSTIKYTTTKTCECDNQQHRDQAKTSAMANDVHQMQQPII
jgi:hypothetical protein